MDDFTLGLLTGVGIPRSTGFGAWADDAASLGGDGPVAVAFDVPDGDGPVAVAFDVPVVVS